MLSIVLPIIGKKGMSAHEFMKAALPHFQKPNMHFIDWRVNLEAQEVYYYFDLDGSSDRLTIDKLKKYMERLYTQCLNREDLRPAEQETLASTLPRIADFPWASYNNTEISLAHRRY